MSLHTFNCLACHIMANSEKLKLSKWRNTNSDKAPKIGVGIIQPISSVKNKSKLTAYSTHVINPDVS